MAVISRRSMIAATLALPACSPLETFNTLARVDKGGGLVASGISYGPHPRQMFDVYRPQKPGTAPVLVYFYGGNWNSGTRQEYAFIGRAFAAGGFVTVIADYRIAPQNVFPDFLNDGAAVIHAVRRRAAEWGGTSGPVYLAGHSAGAYIAVMLGADARYLASVGESRSAIAAIAGIAGPYDFAPFNNAVTQRTFGGAPDPKATQPALIAQAGAPPMLLLHGANDTTVLPKNTISMAQRLASIGTPVEQRIYPGAGHIDIMLALTPNFRRSASTLRDILAYFAARGAAIRSA